MTRESCASGQGHRQEPLLTEAWQGQGRGSAPAPCPPARLLPTAVSRWPKPDGSQGKATEPAARNGHGADGAGRKRRWRTPRPKRLLSGVWGGVSGHRGLHGLDLRRESEAKPVENCCHCAASTSPRVHGHPHSFLQRVISGVVWMAVGLSSRFKSSVEEE